MGISDRQAAESLEITENVLKKIRRILREKKLLKDRQQLDEYSIDFIKKVIERRKTGTFAWEDAVNEVIIAKNLAEQLFNDNTPDSRAGKFFNDYCSELLGNRADKAVDDYFNKFTYCTDFLTSIGQEESVKLLRTLESLIIKSAAFDYLVESGKI